MARKKDDLLKEAKLLDIPIPDKARSEDIMDLIRDVKCKGRDLVKQIDPMLCKDAKDYFDYDLEKPWLTVEMYSRFWDIDCWIAEEKLDGCRFKMHITSDGIRLDSRRRSDLDYAYKERTDNFPQFKLDQELYAFLLEKYEGMVFDGEMLMPVDSIDTGKVVTKGTCNTTVSICNSDPEVSIPLQEKYGWCNFVVFDVLLPDGYKLNYGTRRTYVREFMELAQKLGMPIRMPSFATILKAKFFEDIVENGGEGIILKSLVGLYEEGKRSKFMYKLKKFHTADCFITGWLAGDHKHTGKVGAMLISVYRAEEEVEVGAVGAIPDQLRNEISAPDGSLKQEYYGKVVEIRYQETTKLKRLRHAVLKQWRPDKEKYACDGVDIFGD